MDNNLPTKRNLQEAKRNLLLAKQGHQLLDQKRQMLLHEITRLEKHTVALQQNLQNAIKNARATETGLSPEKFDKICKKIPPAEGLEITTRSIMGVQLPMAKMPAIPAPPYNLAESNAQLDEAYKAWQHVKQSLISLAENQTAIHRLSTESTRTSKRTSALKNIVIPRHEAQIKYISEQLEERERDEMVRAKAAAAKLT
ncbi:MAG: V-type ATP synthase subunit D [Defluviitaleaceae bacterium]|nr:V-type ATP synthase subunit D [Defluviitaleaceae bacterium]